MVIKIEQCEDCGTTTHMLEINYIIINLRIHFLGSVVCAIYETHFLCLYSVIQTQRGVMGLGRRFLVSAIETQPLLWSGCRLVWQKKKKDKNKIGAISFPCSIRTKAGLSVAKCALEMRCKVCAYSGFIRRTEWVCLQCSCKSKII